MGCRQERAEVSGAGFGRFAAEMLTRESLCEPRAVAVTVLRGSHGRGDPLAVLGQELTFPEVRSFLGVVGVHKT